MLTTVETQPSNFKEMSHETATLPTQNCKWTRGITAAEEAFISEKDQQESDWKSQSYLTLKDLSKQTLQKMEKKNGHRKDMTCIILTQETNTRVFPKRTSLHKEGISKSVHRSKRIWERKGAAASQGDHDPKKAV